MSAHIWTVVKPGNDTIKRALDMYKVAIRNGDNPKDACIFAGVLLESWRQTGWRNTVGYNQGNSKIQSYGLIWKSKKKAGSQHLRCANAKHYLDWVRKLVLKHTVLNQEVSHTLSNLITMFCNGGNCRHALHDCLLDNMYEQESFLLKE
jgi:hypothetical protein